jgi:hypothetical protein
VQDIHITTNPATVSPVEPTASGIPDLPDRYRQLGTRTAMEQANAAYSKDTKIASNLRQEGITPEKWLEMGPDAQDAYVTKLGYRGFGKGGPRSRPVNDAVMDVHTRLSQLWGR